MAICSVSYWSLVSTTCPIWFVHEMHLRWNLEIIWIEIAERTFVRQQWLEIDQGAIIRTFIRVLPDHVAVRLIVGMRWWLILIRVRGQLCQVWKRVTKCWVLAFLLIKAAPLLMGQILRIKALCILLDEMLCTWIFEKRLSLCWEALWRHHLRLWVLMVDIDVGLVRFIADERLWLLVEVPLRRVIMEGRPALWAIRL